MFIMFFPTDKPDSQVHSQQLNHSAFGTTLNTKKKKNKTKQQKTLNKLK